MEEVVHGVAILEVHRHEGMAHSTEIKLTPEEIERLNAWLREHCTFSARSWITYAPSSSFHADGITVSLAVSGSLITINAPSGQYVSVREPGDEAILRLMHLH